MVVVPGDAAGQMHNPEVGGKLFPLFEIVLEVLQLAQDCPSGTPSAGNGNITELLFCRIAGERVHSSIECVFAEETGTNLMHHLVALYDHDIALLRNIDIHCSISEIPLMEVRFCEVLIP